MKKICTAIIFAAVSNMANASNLARDGIWVSGGGELESSQRNPWFINNTPKVSYCIGIDEEHFGINREKVKEKVINAVRYWQNEFALAPRNERADSSNNLPTVTIGNQLFEEGQCDDSTMLRFQFGVLDDAQKVYLQDSRSLVGVAVRTNYDTKNMRGKGFIYISPQFGSLSLKGADVHSRAWELGNGKLLELLLIHELGHVFGLQHSGDAGEIMSEEFPSTILGKTVAPYFSKFNAVAPYFSAHNGIEYGGCQDYPISKDLVDAIGVPQGWKCLKAKLNLGVLGFYAAISQNSEYMHIGTASKSSALSQSYINASKLYLTPDQQVFKSIPLNVSVLKIYPKTIMTQSIHQYRRVDGGDSISLILSLMPQELSGTVVNNNGTVELNLLSLSSWSN